MLSCYAHKYAASREAKEEFYDNLQSVLDEIPEDMYVILGDFNARVGSRGADDDQWWRVRGPCGLGMVNEAGAELLNFLLLNGTTICNTWFQKRNIHGQTWQHPKTRNWHCIDYVMMREKDHRRCVDVEVKRGAECHTDHQLLRAKLLMARQWFRKGKKMASKRYAVSHLSDARTGEEMKQLFARTAAVMVKSKWSIRDMQRGHCGLVPTRTAAMVRDEDGTPCKTTHKQHQRWRRYFSSVLNICAVSHWMSWERWNRDLSEPTWLICQQWTNCCMQLVT